MQKIKTLFKHEATGGALLFLAAVLAIYCENSSYQSNYRTLQEYKITVGSISLSTLHWVNDLLMAIFFLMVGMEIKREVLIGALSTRSRLALPMLGALGGIVLPALIYVFFNRADDIALRGWAIPAATDIAFALGVLSLFGRRLAPSLKIFLVALAILDDLAAILIIAFFYTAELNLTSLMWGGACFVPLFLMNKLGVKRFLPYALVGAVLWYFVYKSGVHATLAGVTLAFFIPLRITDSSGSPLEHLIHRLHPWVTFAILPLFSFLNAGVSLQGITLESILLPLPLGIALGLFIGKQIGVFCCSFLAIRLGWAAAPEGSTTAQLYAVSVVTGIGFTMSLFIGGLAFSTAEYAAMVRLGVIVGSLLSAVFGILLLSWTLPKDVLPVLESTQKS